VIKKKTNEQLRRQTFTVGRTWRCPIESTLVYRVDSNPGIGRKFLAAESLVKPDLPEIIVRRGSLIHMLDQASLKLFLRARADLIAAMFLIGRRVRRKRVHDLTYVRQQNVAPNLPATTRAMAASTHS
jgi:hypothetical protein